MAERWDTETKEKAVWLVIDHRSDYSLDSAAITTVAARLGKSAETLRKRGRIQRGSGQMHRVLQRGTSPLRAGRQASRRRLLRGSGHHAGWPDTDSNHLPVA